jgi:hypothetical protein
VVLVDSLTQRLSDSARPDRYTAIEAINLDEASTIEDA